MQERLGELQSAYNSTIDTVLTRVRDFLCKEYGAFYLEDEHARRSVDVVNFFLKTEDTRRALDFIQLAFLLLGGEVTQQSYVEACEELNARFREHGIGFQYESARIIRADSELLHAEVVRPVLHLLRADHLKGAEQEFLLAHEHYREGRFKEAMNECLKSFESTLKGVCVKRGWKFEAKATVKDLIDLVFEKNLIPPYLKSHFSGLRSCLESGVPTVRNKASGHGQGPEITTVPASIVSYVLHATATAIKFLDDADREKN